MTTPISLSSLSDTELLALIAGDVVAGRGSDVVAATREALDRGLMVDAIMQRGLVAGMDIVSADFRANRIFVPEMAVAARAMKAGLEAVRAGAALDAPPTLGTAVIGTVRSDLHDLGKTLVCMALAGAGFAVVDLGVNVKPEAFVQAVADRQPQVLCLSALLSTSIPFVQETVAALVAAGLRDGLFVIVGGAPLNDGFARQYGADAYAPDASSAAAAAAEWVQRHKGSPTTPQEHNP